jgi:DNA-binding transcriptional LysR family regulator
MDLFDSMKVLVAVVEAGSLSAAARRIGMPLATVSRKVSELEASLNTRLLTRSSRRLVVTDTGQVYLVACKRILEQVAEAERAASGEYSAPTGEMTIAAPVAFGRLHVLPIAGEFLGAYPDIDLRIIFSDRISHILDDHIDLAVRVGTLPDSNLVASRVGAIRRIVCASPRYFAQRGMPSTPSDLTSHDCVTFDQLTSPDLWFFSDGKSEAAVPIHSRLIVNTAEAAIDAVIAGIGVTRVLSYQAAAGLRDGTLALALESFEPAPWPVNLVHAGQGPLPLKLRAFLDFAAPRLKARLLGLANS